MVPLSRSSFRLLAGLVALAGWLYVTSSLAHATVTFQPVSPDELKMTKEPAAPGAPAVILFREVDRDDDASRPHEDIYVRLKILTEAGRKYADVEIPFVKGFVDVSNFQARSIAPDGTISEYQGKMFEKTIVKAKGVSYLAKVFTLPNVQTGSVLEYYYTYDFREYYIYESHWILSEDLFTRDAKFSLKSYNAQYGSVTLHWSWRGLPAGTNPPALGGDHIIRMEAHNIPAFQHEDFMPPPNELKSRVDFVYSFEPPERDKDKFWAQVGKRRYDQLESL